MKSSVLSTFRPNRSVYECIYDGALWALLFAFVTVPFGYAAPVACAGGFALLGLAYGGSRVRGRPFSFLDYSKRDFIILFVSGVVLVYPLWAAAFVIILALWVYVGSLFK